MQLCDPLFDESINEKLQVYISCEIIRMKIDTRGKCFHILLFPYLKNQLLLKVASFISIFESI